MGGTNTTGPQIILGTMGFGTRVDPDRAFAILDSFVAGGGVWLDTLAARRVRLGDEHLARFAEAR
jgi:aryl-alcohol dehydrogenase-like predicted oxidoreductase